jgi:HK97 family phage prohead protease
MTDRIRLAGATERRNVAVSDFEVRTEGDELVLDGYASVFESPYDVFGGPDRGGWTEIVDRKAFDASLAKKPDVHLLVNHEGLPLARTKSGTMDLMTDRRGLRVIARLERNDPDVAALAPKMRRRDVDEMSFAFRTVRQEWNEDEDERRLLEVNIHKGDVSVVNFGANDATSVQLRRLSDAVALLAADVDPDAVLAELRGAFDDPYQALAEAQRTIGELLRSRRDHLTVAAAEALLAAPR